MNMGAYINDMTEDEFLRLDRLVKMRTCVTRLFVGIAKHWPLKDSKNRNNCPP